MFYVFFEISVFFYYLTSSFNSFKGVSVYEERNFEKKYFVYKFIQLDIITRGGIYQHSSSLFSAKGLMVKIFLEILALLEFLFMLPAKSQILSFHDYYKITWNSRQIIETFISLQRRNKIKFYGLFLPVLFIEYIIINTGLCYVLRNYDIRM